MFQKETTKEKAQKFTRIVTYRGRKRIGRRGQG
jgi:hypothetical protein